MGRGIVPDALHPSTESGVLPTQSDNSLVEKSHRRAVALAFCVEVCAVRHSYARSRLCDTRAPRGTPCASQNVVQVPSPGAFLQYRLGQLVSRSWESCTEMA